MQRITEVSNITMVGRRYIASDQNVHLFHCFIVKMGIPAKLK